MNAALRCGKCIWWSLRLLELYTKSSSNSLHHGTLSSVHIICTYRVLCGQKMYKVTAVTKSTIYPPTPSHRRAAVIKTPKKVLINILIFELKAVGKIFSQRTNIFFVDCKILERNPSNFNWRKLLSFIYHRNMLYVHLIKCHEVKSWRRIMYKVPAFAKTTIYPPPHRRASVITAPLQGVGSRCLTFRYSNGIIGVVMNTMSD